MSLNDSPKRYGSFTRLLHWSMALLLIWQFLSALAHYGFEDTAFESFFWPTHKPLGSEQRETNHTCLRVKQYKLWQNYGERVRQSEKGADTSAPTNKKNLSL